MLWAKRKNLRQRFERHISYFTWRRIHRQGHCCTTLSSNSMHILWQEKVMSSTEDYYQGRPLNETDNNELLDKELQQENRCYCVLKRYMNKFHHCFKTSQPKNWTEVPQAGTKATPDTSDEEKKRRGLNFARRHRRWILAEWKKM